jgi:hypothetical protein
MTIFWNKLDWTLCPKGNIQKGNTVQNGTIMRLTAATQDFAILPTAEAEVSSSGTSLHEMAYLAWKEDQEQRATQESLRHENTMQLAEIRSAREPHTTQSVASAPQKDNSRWRREHRKVEPRPTHSTSGRGRH